MSSDLALYQNHPHVQVVSTTDEAPAIVKRLAHVVQDPEHIDAQIVRYKAIKRHSPADKKVLTSLEAIADGRAIVSLNATIVGGGRDTTMNHIPQLGVARPFQKYVTCRVFPAGDVTYRRPRRFGRSFTPFYTFSHQKFADLGARDGTYYSALAAVPPVPPEVRERHAAALRSSDSLILFEADWTNCQTHEPPMPTDPALVQRISGDLWAVLAVWELTAVEIAALT